MVCGGVCRSRRAWQAGRPGISRQISVDPSTAVQAAAAGRRPDIGGMSHEDDSLMMCLIAEFGESSRLVADVFNSLRRLDGTYLPHRHVANRVRCFRRSCRLCLQICLQGLQQRQMFRVARQFACAAPVELLAHVASCGVSTCGRVSRGRAATLCYLPPRAGRLSSNGPGSSGRSACGVPAFIVCEDRCLRVPRVHDSQGVHELRSLSCTKWVQDKSRAVNKEDARRVLRHMLPCSGTTVAKYCQAIKPSALRLAQERQSDTEIANNKRGEFAMHGMPAHKSQQVFLQQAMVPFNGSVPNPVDVLRWRRAGGGMPAMGAVPVQFVGDARGGGGAAAQPPQPPSAGGGPQLAVPPPASAAVSRDGSMPSMHAQRGMPTQGAGQMAVPADDPAMQMGPAGVMGPVHGASTPPLGAPGHPQYQHMDAAHASQPQVQQQVLPPDTAFAPAYATLLPPPITARHGRM